MKTEINKEGLLSIKPESELESYALKQMGWRKFKGRDSLKNDNFINLLLNQIMKTLILFLLITVSLTAQQIPERNYKDAVIGAGILYATFIQ